MKNLILPTLCLLLPLWAAAKTPLQGRLTVDIIPDFSMVGYKNGDVPIPKLPVKAEISLKSVSEALASGQAADTTDHFQQVIDRVGREGGGAVLVRDGVYNISRLIFIDRDNVVVRGESTEKTIIMSNGTVMRPVFAIGRTIKDREVKSQRLVVAGAGGHKTFGSFFLDRLYPTTDYGKYGKGCDIVEDYVPVGRFYVKVADPTMFEVGEEVAIFRPHSPEWIHDIGMDRIADNGRSAIKAGTIQWSTRNMRMYWTRKIVAIKGNNIYFEAPTVQSLDRNYGGGRLVKYSRKHISGSGLENMTIDSYYDPSIKDKDGYEVDEKHTWVAVTVTSAEDCWVRNVTSYHMGYAFVELRSGSRCITVENCSYLKPVSVRGGARRYGFCLTEGELCLVKNCTAEAAAIGFAANGVVRGPNVFTDCKGISMRTSSGPHQSWANGTLYDCVVTDAGFVAEDRGCSGTGHGWIGANTVFWNVEAKKDIRCYCPWAAENTPSIKFASRHPSGRNYAIGAVCGIKNPHRNLRVNYYGKPTVDYYIDTLGIQHRPDGIWYPYIEDSKAGTQHIDLPDAAAEKRFDWWPQFTLTKFTNPRSLYQCQLEDRHARGIYYYYTK